MKTLRPLSLLAALLAAASLGWPLRAPAADSPAAAPVPAKVYPYALTTGDTVRIAIQGETEVIPPQHIDTQGNISLPLLDDFHIAGLTRDQAEHAIADAYVKGRFFRHPDITLSIDDYAQRDVTITGQVKNPGRYPLPIETVFSVVDLVTHAGGFTDIAKGSNITITHTSATGEKTILHVDVQAILKGNGSVKQNDPSLILQPGDLVFVPESII